MQMIMDDKPLTIEDLYGKEDSPQQSTSGNTLDYEETPEIPMTESHSHSQEHPMTPDSVPDSSSREFQEGHTEPRRGCLGFVGRIVIFLLLFVAGIWLSSYVRQFFPNGIFPSTSETTTPIGASGVSSTSGTLQNSDTWKAYDVLSGRTRESFNGVTFKLPSSILSPICDGAGCASQGTYLPGGTRFTVAARGTGQVLADSRGAAISDVGGMVFTTKDVTVAGFPATEFTGVFTGKTISGYRFTRMRGVMIELTPTTSLEVNHFAPTGISADFEEDDALFDAILKSITVTGVTPNPTGTP